MAQTVSTFRGGRRNSNLGKRNKRNNRKTHRRKTHRSKRNNRKTHRRKTHRRKTHRRKTHRRKTHRRKSRSGGNNATDITVLWIRHGFSKANKAGYVEGNWFTKKRGLINQIMIKDPQLSEEGIRQSTERSIILNDKITSSLNSTVKVVFCSAMRRSIATALLMFANDVTVIVCPFLIEKGRTLDNTIYSSPEKQQPLIGNTVDTVDSNNDYVFGRINYTHVCNKHDKSFTSDAKKSNIPKFLSWLSSKNCLTAKIAAQGGVIPVVSHSKLISKYIKDMNKNNPIVEKLDNNGAIKIEYELNCDGDSYNPKKNIEPCCLIEGYRNKKGVVVQNLLNCAEHCDKTDIINGASCVGRIPMIPMIPTTH